MRELKLQSSRLQVAVLGVLGLMACLAIALSDLPLPSQVGLMAGVGVAIAWQSRRAARLPRLAVDTDGDLHLWCEAGDWREVTVLPDSLVTSALIVLRYRPPDERTRTLTLWPDSAVADELRRLRVSLRWARRTRSDTSSPDAG